jgi:recombination protein RecT
MAAQQNNRQPQTPEAKAAQWEVIVAEVEEDFNKIAIIDNLVHFEREGKFAVQIISASEYLPKCSTASIRNAITNVAAVGLTLNPAMKLAYLVPRDGLCCLDISYIGLKKLATDTGSVLDAAAEIVRANDKFEYNGPYAPPTHKFDPFDNDEQRGEIRGVYVWAKLHNGIDRIETLDMDEIKKIKSKSKAKSGPWQEWFEEMVKKAAMKRASKNWPRTERLAAAEAILNEHEGNVDAISGSQRIKRDNGADIAGQVQAAAAEEAGAGTPEMNAVKATLEAAAKKGLDVYKKAWMDITKAQRQALAGDHERWKKIATDADVSDVEFADVPSTTGLP